MSVNDLTWTCSVCKKIHRGLPAIAFDAPATEEQLKKVLAEINYPVAA